MGLPGSALYRIQGTHRLEMVMQEAEKLSMLVRTLQSLELCGFQTEHASEHGESLLYYTSLGPTLGASEYRGRLLRPTSLDPTLSF